MVEMLRYKMVCEVMRGTDGCQRDSRECERYWVRNMRVWERQGVTMRDVEDENMRQVRE